MTSTSSYMINMDAVEGATASPPTDPPLQASEDTAITPDEPASSLTFIRNNDLDLFMDFDLDTSLGTSSEFFVTDGTTLPYEGPAETAEAQTPVATLAADLDQVDYISKLRHLNPTNISGESPWIDDDRSGNYNPEQPRLLRSNRIFKDENVEERRHASQRRSKLEQKRSAEFELCCSSEHKYCKGVVMLKLPTVKWSQLRGEITSYWPQNACLERGNRLCHIFDDVSNRNIITENLRSQRGSATGQPRPFKNPEADPTGKPAFHGCWACFKDGIERCSIIRGGRWPCDHCKAEGEECELIRPPVKKRRCGHCKRKKLHCSYKDEPQSDQACQACQGSGLKCIAGPAKNGMPQRYSYDTLKAVEREKASGRKHETNIDFKPCNPCRESGTRCTPILSAEDHTNNPDNFSCIVCQMQKR
ncbi:hypothetical protein K461DRAFT_126877 [Myriangium duriaei CBS 260.36]|uniref:Zn(2)-C6 fungal-type domain-containing protein n=1 Tax=Myriangium duriaei CBS 260.36 TaxID=1168546 RepID=A0A9P4J572_9PEZI|nr:hypothetical protein K461DRAFT_126877 [Myriangium duriaei CBS 260.36]